MSGATPPMEWSDLYVRHVLQAALVTQRTRDMYQLVLHRAAHQSAMPDTAAASARSADLERHLAESLTALAAQFLAGLLRVGCDATQPAPPFDAKDLLGWNRELAAYAARMNAGALEAWMERATQHSELGAAPHPGAERAAERINAFGRVYFDLLSGLTQLGATAEQQFLRAVLATFDAPHPDQPVIDLKAPCGKSAVATLSLENTRESRAHIECRLGPVRRADGIGPAFDADLRVQPMQFSLEPREELGMRLSLILDRKCYEPNVLYVGGVSVMRDGDPPLHILLRITAIESTLGAP